VGHPPYRVVLDASRSYGHVVVELYTTRLGGLSYNDFSLAQMIDSALNTYRKKAAATSATQTSSA
jgi:pterin-4a-carbinolamine dehydratase